MPSTEPSGRDPTRASSDRRPIVGARPAEVASEPWATEERRRRAWIVVAVMVLVVGVTASVLGGIAWDGYQQTQTRRAFATTASTVSAATEAALQRDLDFTASLQGYVSTASPPLTNAGLSAWMHSIGVTSRYPGSFGFGYVVPISLADLPAFVSDVQADPPAGQSVVPYQVVPSGDRAVYCLMRLADQVRPLPLPAGIDFCYPNGQWLIDLTAKGGTSVFSFMALLESEAPSSALPPSVVQALQGIFLVASAVHQSPAASSPTAGSPSGTGGWIVSTYSAKTVLDASLGSATGIRVTLSYHEPGGRPAVIGSAGSVGNGARLTTVRPILLGGGVHQSMQVVVSQHDDSAASLQGLVVALGGILLTLLLAGFLFYLARSRRRALRIVDLQTGELRYQALHDNLTGLPNRALILDRTQQFLLRAEREPIVVGALYLDIDNFKDINDTYGHQVGDQLLRAVAVRLQAALRGSDTVGRLGGDEFFVLVESDSYDTGPELVAQRIQDVLAAPLVLGGPDPIELRVRASIGVAVGVRESADDLMRDADVALYEAKAAGRNRSVVFLPAMQSAIRERLDLEQELRTAIDEQQLFVVYQPIFDLTSVTPKGVEALVRWHHPERGVLGPDVFIPLAEDTGLIVPIGRLVLRTACRQAMAWREAGHPIDVAVNVSARQLSSGVFVEDVRSALEESGLDPQSLTLEITETVIMRDTEANTRLLGKLKELGIRISIDDFGTGYSSLSYLRQFPIDSLKIDRSFITRVSESSQSSVLIHTLIQLGKALGIETLAEGIEEESQLRRLQREHCDSGQGFLFARPLSPELIVPFFEQTERSGGEPVRAAAGGRRPGDDPAAGH